MAVDLQDVGDDGEIRLIRKRAARAWGHGAADELKQLARAVSAPGAEELLTLERRSQTAREIGGMARCAARGVCLLAGRRLRCRVRGPRRLRRAVRAPSNRCA